MDERNYLIPIGSYKTDRSDSEHVALKAQLDELARLLERHSGYDGIHLTAIPGVAIHRVSIPNGEPMHGTHEPAMCLVVQGEKHVILNDKVYAYDASRFLVVSVDVPITGQITKASAKSPYLAFQMGLDPVEIATLILQANIPPVVRHAVLPALKLTTTSAELLDAVLRLTRLLDAPEDIATLGPLAKREILYRLLKGEQGQLLRQIAETDGRSSRISRAIRWLKMNFNLQLNIDELARQVNMSPSSFYRHFKAITSMSPLQYQKQLRLQEARRLMLVHDLDAATAGHRVGYESSSQFGREYSRFFGVPPARDLRSLRSKMPDKD